MLLPRYICTALQPWPAHFECRQTQCCTRVDDLLTAVKHQLCRHSLEKVPHQIRMEYSLGHPHHCGSLHNPNLLPFSIAEVDFRGQCRLATHSITGRSAGDGDKDGAFASFLLKAKLTARLIGFVHQPEAGWVYCLLSIHLHST